ncbi:ribosome hibernation promoting factor [Shewanella sp. SR43-4]|jgi:putative sigma-54 modulation protein|uniref:Ribosome hibernation promoting factor n=1 Tax=Shewanella vesiculosa TaxID=518738 RepID=A0ABV0FWX5_9GAMM|nr:MULTISPECIES: ribosome hibernation promoting factor [Shewanella]NCQ45332.1 ribosome hibernation promoting factor [Shewanella frigidimarina]MBB1316222.1 ribosome hibernation promoting factor [Shewanella sp. SR43-4]MBB1320974.1 ribosome hibernation promoting factor [Shewanella sp. SR43-8]MBB1391372.1 ribosome hibernation promoting factor [Shewanella sp. SG44-6]MBB1475362.1 ribosome hibernation promoting factor [Shewanella sp. SG41-3]|tara:strand:- start:21 stop:308 length:288 start_codon:yes stop_codon:yes gene_type:complete
MLINMTGRNIDITESLREYVQGKFSKLERHFDQINNVHVVLNVEKLQQKAEAKINLNGAEIFAMSESTDMYAAIDALIDKLDRQVIKHKEKYTKH